MKLLILLALFCGAMAQEPVKDSDPNTDAALDTPWKMSGGSNYIFHSTPQTWANAHMHCLTTGGHLVVLNSKEEDDFVKGLAGGKATWIGLSDAQQSGSWFWINSQPLGYTNWCPGQPDNYNGNQECGMTNFSDQKCWDDQRCANFLTYVCEREITP